MKNAASKSGWNMFKRWMVLGLVFLAMPAMGQDLSTLIERASAYEFGQSQAGLRALEAEIREASADPGTRAAAAEALANALTGDATPDAKRHFCRLLAIVGDASSVPALASLLDDPDVGEMAAYALARIDAPQAAEALRVRPSDASDPRNDIDRILRAAEKHHAVGDSAIAAQLYEKVLEDAKKEHQRFAAIRGLAITRGPSEARSIVSMLASDDARTRAFAERLIAEVPGEAMTLAFVSQFQLLSDNGKPRIFDALARRGDRAAASAITRFLTDEKPDIRDAAIRALGKLGDAQSARAIAGVLAIDSRNHAALDALVHMRAPMVDDAIASMLGEADDTLAVPLIQVLAARRASDHADALLPLATSESAHVQRAALQALAQIGSRRHLDRLASLLRDGSGNESAERAVAAIVARADDHDAATAQVISDFEGASLDAQRSLLRILGEVAGDRALAHVTRALDDDALRTSALETLARRWPDDGAIKILIQIASSPRDEGEGDVALAGALRLADKTNLREPAASAVIYRRLSPLVQNEREKRILLKGITRVADPGVLAIAQSMFDDPALASDARAATLTIATRLDREHRLAALAAVDAVREEGSASLREACNRAQDRIESDLDFITSWEVSGPYGGVAANELIPTPFPPETADRAVNWRELRTTSPTFPGRFDLNKQIGGQNHCVYIRTQLWIPRNLTVRFEIGSDDGVKAFIDGRAVLERNVMRGLTLGEDVVEVDLDRGWHTLMLKISQGNGGWELACRVRGTDSLHIPGLRAVANPSRAAPPIGATTLFDGQDASHWTHPNGGDPRWSLDRGRMTVRPGSGPLVTREPLGSGLYYVEFMTSEHPPDVRGQARGNSGVYLQGRYEVQVLDSWGDAPAHNRCAGIYGKKTPDAAVGARPREWQTYLIDFTAPRWNEGGEKTANARLTVWHNGVLVHDNVEVDSSTGAGRQEAPQPAPLLLQDHGNLISYGRIWHQPRPTTWEGSDAPGFSTLIRDDSLDGWTQRGGNAEYRVEDGVIIGQTRPNQPNSFLCTDAHYGDFVLELEFKVDQELNSGVQIRSNSDPAHQSGRVHGYQVEIDPSPRAWSAGIYDEGRRGWLADLSQNEGARRAFRQNEWNRVRVVARSDEIQTFLNGVPAAQLRDDMTPSGFIALQVHGVGGRTDPLEVRWRDIRIRELK